MNKSGFIEASKEIPFCYPGESFLGIKAFFRGYFSSDDKIYEVKHLSKHLILIEEKKITHPKLQNFLKRILSITLIAPLIGYICASYNKRDLSTRKVAIYRPIPEKDPEEFKQCIRKFDNSRIQLHRFPVKALEAKFMNLNRVEHASTIATLAAHQTAIIDDFIDTKNEIKNKDVFKELNREKIVEDLTQLIKTKADELLNYSDLNSIQDPPAFMEFLMNENAILEKLAISDENFQFVVADKAVKLLSHSDQNSMVAVMEYIQHHYGDELVRKILNRKMETIFERPYLGLDIDIFEIYFIEPHEDILKVARAGVILNALTESIQSDDLDLPSCTHSLQEICDLLPETFDDTQKSEGFYEILKNMIDSLKHSPTLKTLNLLNLTPFKNAYDSVASKFDISPMEIEIDTENDELGALQINAREIALRLDDIYKNQ